MPFSEKIDVNRLNEILESLRDEAHAVASAHQREINKLKDTIEAQSVEITALNTKNQQLRKALKQKTIKLPNSELKLKLQIEQEENAQILIDSTRKNLNILRNSLTCYESQKLIPRKTQKNPKEEILKNIQKQISKNQWITLKRFSMESQNPTNNIQANDQNRRERISAFCSKHQDFSAKAVEMKLERLKVKTRTKDKEQNVFHKIPSIKRIKFLTFTR